MEDEEDDDFNDNISTGKKASGAIFSPLITSLNVCKSNQLLSLLTLAQTVYLKLPPEMFENWFDKMNMEPKIIAKIFNSDLTTKHVHSGW